MTLGNRFVRKNSFAWMTHPLSLLCGAMLGIYIGIYFPSVAEKIAPYGDVYISLINMTVFPILITAVSYSFATMLRSRPIRTMFKKLAFIYLLGMTFSALLGVGVGHYSNVGATLDQGALTEIGEQIRYNENVAQNKISPISNFTSFMERIIPDNIVNVYTESNTLAILIFSILLGLSLGLVSSRAGSSTLQVIEGLYESFIKLLHGIIYFLPFALIAITSGLLSRVGVDFLLSMKKLIIIIYLGSVVLFLLYSYLIHRKSQCGIWNAIKFLRRPLTIGFTTSTTFAAMPNNIRALLYHFNLKEKHVKLCIPFGSALGEQASPFLYSLMLIFILQLYGIPMDWLLCLVIIVGSIFVGVTAGGAPPAVALTMLTVPLNILGLPSEAAVAIFLMMIHVLDPMVTAVNIQANSAATIAVSAQHKHHK